MSTLFAYGIVFQFVSNLPVQSVSWVRIEGAPLVASIGMYAYEGAGLVLSLERSSFAGCSSGERQIRFRKMFVFSMIVITVLYVAFGACGYAAWGDATDAVLTRNLGAGSWSANAIKAALSLSLIFTYPVVMTPVTQILDKRLSRRFVGSFGIRLAVVATTGTVVIFFPNFGALMEIVGGSACALLSFIMPALFHLQLAPNLTARQRAVDWALCTFGSGLAIVCTVIAVARVTHDFR